MATIMQKVNPIEDEMARAQSNYRLVEDKTGREILTPASKRNRHS